MDQIRIVPIRAARDDIADIVDNAQHRGIPTIITRYGRPAALVVPLEWGEGRIEIRHREDGGGRGAALQAVATDIGAA